MALALLGAAVAWLAWGPRTRPLPAVVTETLPPLVPAAETPLTAARRVATAPEVAEVEPLHESLADWRRTGAEEKLYAELRGLGRRDAAALREIAAQALLPTTPDVRRIALLRACYDTSPDAAVPLFVAAIRDLPPDGTPEVALTFLGRRALRDAASRRALEELSTRELERLALPLRRRATGVFVAAADPEQLARLAPILLRETDTLVVEGAVAALAQNPDPRAAGLLAHRIGREVPVVSAGTDRQQ